MLFYAQSTIEATDEGLRAVEAGKWIGWQQAHLFACYRLPNWFGPQSSIIYELASKHTVITWNRVLDPQAAWTLWELSLPSERYDEQMKALCSLIVAKTGLPLIDLSDPRTN